MPVSPFTIGQGRLIVHALAPASVVTRPSYWLFRTVVRIVRDGSKSEYTSSFVAPPIARYCASMNT